MNANIAAPLLPLAIPITDCHPDPTNARTGHAIDRIAASLRQYGQRKPIVVNVSEGGKIEAGNGTWEAARSLGWTHIAAVTVEDDPMTAVGYGIADNRTGHLSEWDAEILAILAESLPPETYTGFEGGELEELLAELGAGLDAGTGNGQCDANPQVDRAEELRQVWRTELEQLWQIGEHRLIVGDCTDGAVVERVMGGERADGCFTSPPYAMQRKDTYGGTPVDGYVDWWGGVQASIRGVLADAGSFFVNIKPHCEDGQRVLYVFDLVLAMVREWGWVFVDEMCWRNTKNGVPGTWPNRFKNAFEPVYHFANQANITFLPEQAGHKSAGVFDYHPLNQDSTTGTPFTGAYKHLGYRDGIALPSNVIEVPAEGAGLHSAPFPVELPAFFINAFSRNGNVWLDPFGGSGTTMVACQNLGRRCMMVEISPAYCAVILQRMADAFPGIDIRQVET